MPINKFFIKSITIFLLFIITTNCDKKPPLKLNQIQLLGSHNSYKKRIQKELWQLIYYKDSIQALELDYGHISLINQLNKGLRSLELDVFYDPEGGRFTSPLGQKLISQQNQTPLPFDTNEQMKTPGLKVFHIQDIDYRSHCLLFKTGLKQLKKWSLNNPNHLPIIITMNAKDEIIDLPGFTPPLVFDEKALNVIDEEIRSIFSESQLITPDFVRGKFKTLETAILTNGWPTINESKGKFLFVLDEGGEKRKNYLKNHPSLQGRVLFTVSPPGNPESAFLIINNPIQDLESIQNFVKLGYLVRTRADEGTWEARKNDYTRWKSALKSGAQIISTDYYEKDTFFNTGYQIKLDNELNYITNPINKNTKH